MIYLTLYCTKHCIILYNVTDSPQRVQDLNIVVQSNPDNIFNYRFNILLLYYIINSLFIIYYASMI